MIVLVPVAFALGWAPGGRWALALAGVVLGTAAFAGIGLPLAGTLRGEVNLAAANGLYLVLLLLGGMVFPLDELPAGLAQVAQLLPSAALAEVLRRAHHRGGAGPGVVRAAGLGRRRPGAGRPHLPLGVARRHRFDIESVEAATSRVTGLPEVRAVRWAAGRSGSGAGGTVSNTRVTSS